MRVLVWVWIGVLELLGNATGARRVVVGHTPSREARRLCDGALLAVDSSLARPFRRHGNLYCPLVRTKPGPIYTARLACRS